MTYNRPVTRSLQKQAHEWESFSQTSYASALRQLRDPMAQGLLDRPVNALRLIEVLRTHNLIGTKGGPGVLDDEGYGAALSWSFDRKTDLIQLALVTEFLRSFERVPIDSTSGASSYELKHTAELFLGRYSTAASSVSNGKLIWAAAALGLPMMLDGDRPNVLIGISEREHDYVRRMVDSGRTDPRTDHYRPARYEQLRSALSQAAAGEYVARERVAPPVDAEPAPFHLWLGRQLHRDDSVGDLARDYDAGVRDSDHEIARAASDLLATFRQIPHSAEAYDALVMAIREWMRDDPEAEPVRTERIGGSVSEHAGWGAGAGDTERYDYFCPCGDGKIVEEHDNVPGFREHDVNIRCSRCDSDWRFVSGRSVRGWGLEPRREEGRTAA